MSFKSLSLSVLFFLIFSVVQVQGAYLSRPELVDFNFANADICEKVNLTIKFDYQLFSTGNVFTVEVSSPSGSFSVPTTLIGSLAISGSQQNVFLTVAFPSSILAGNSYRLRVKGSSPLTYSSQLNEYPFTISKLVGSNPNYFPTGYWLGSMYNWTPSTTGVITDGSLEDIFNPDNYVGYITEDTLAFEYNWAGTILAPGTFPDTVKVCGAYRDNFSLRMKRRIYFENGLYIFGGGADDGFRLSIDGGTTWLINDWNDHSYQGSLLNGGCGVPMTAGYRDVVVDFYEHIGEAHFRTIIKKTGDPAISPIGIVSPLNGVTICSNSAPIALVGNPPGAYQWSGSGVSAAGWLNPAIGPLGPRIITYQTGFAAFSQNCIKTTTITVNIVAGLSAQFSGLDSVYCSTQTTTVPLVPQNPGGNFFGAGVGLTGFQPSMAGPGFHQIAYALNISGGCSDTVYKTVHVYAPVIPVITPIPASICSSSPSIALSATPLGGLFSGPGVLGSIFNPTGISPGLTTITYTINQGACISSTSVSTTILQAPTATVSFPQTNFCLGDNQKLKVTYSPLGGQLTGPGLLNDSVKISSLNQGQYSIRYVVSNGTCSDTAVFIFSINSLPDASFNNLPDTVCVGSPNITLIPITPGGQFVGQGVMPPNQFIPSILLPDNTYKIEYVLTMNSCSNRSEQFVNILSKLKPTIQFPSLKSTYCTSDEAFVPVSQPMGQFYLNGNLVSQINPASLSAGNYVLKTIFRPLTDLECIDSASAKFNFTIIANPKPDLGADLEIETGTEVHLDPKVSGTWTWTTSESGIDLPPNVPANFKPHNDLTVSVLAKDPTGTCSGSDEVDIKLIPSLIFPNLFTPNGDPFNQEWRILGAVQDLKVLIYDRWGTEVYSGTSQGELAWDGTGAEKSGVYFYLVENPKSGKKWNGWLMVAQ